MPQTTGTGALAQAQNTIIEQMLYTEEHNAPTMATITQMNLKKGASTVDIPKAGQISMSDLVEGQDIVDEEELGIEFTTLTSSEVGAKIIITDKLLRQMQHDVFKVVGRQMGDGMARKKDTDVLALYSGFSNGLGAAGATLSIDNVAVAYTFAVANKFGSKLSIVGHPNSIYSVIRSASIVPETSNDPLPTLFGNKADILRPFFSGLSPIGNVPIFQDGNISVDANDDAIGAIYDEGALVVLKSVDMKTERERDASLRGTEVVVTADYGVFELDDSRGASMTYDAAAPSSS